MTDPQTWNEIARQCADLQAENAELREENTKSKKQIAQSAEGCEYCTKEKDITVVKDGKRFVAAIYLHDNYIAAECEDFTFTGKIVYCPMCGRKL
jgi:superfamily II helicase